MKTDHENFIMRPTVDFCFKELMQNPKVRKGFIAALLHISPEKIKYTKVLPTILPKEHREAKQGILDVRIMLCNGIQLNMEMQVKYFEYWDERILFYLSKMYAGQLKKGDSYANLHKCIHVSILDFNRFPEDDVCYRKIYFWDSVTGKKYTDKLEIQILELKKLPPGVQSGEEILNWMRFFNGKCREEFEDMAKTNEYLDEAYNTLLELSADELKRLEYEAREKALRDHNAMMSSARKTGLKEGRREGLKQGREEGIKEGLKEGLKEGIKEGLKQGVHTTKQVFKLHLSGKSVEEISKECGLSTEEVKEILM